MQIEDILARDFAALTARFSDDGFSARVLERLRSVDRLRLCALGAAGAAGAGLAASQFDALTSLLAGVAQIAALSEAAPEAAAAPALMTTLIFAIAGGATALLAPAAR